MSVIAKGDSKCSSIAKKNPGNLDISRKTYITAVDAKNSCSLCWENAQMGTLVCIVHCHPSTSNCMCVFFSNFYSVPKKICSNLTYRSPESIEYFHRSVNSISENPCTFVPKIPIPIQLDFLVHCHMLKHLI